MTKTKNITCCNRKDIKIDDYLFNQIMSGDVVIFAGAGISTENKKVLPFTFYDEIANELNLKNSNLSFPSLMEKFSNQPDGKSRLIKKIQKRFDYINSFSGLEKMATTFHKELATLYPVKTIITTNWDTYFEKYCNAIPFVSDEDMAFWDDKKRSVLKIHGSITSYGSIIATETDYKNTELKLHKGLLGSKLKTILAEKNMIFIGYSFNDSDFHEIYNFVKESIGDFHKQSYVVTPFENEAKRFKDLNFIPLITDGTYFIEQIKLRAISEKKMLNDEIYLEADLLLSKLYRLHSEIHSKIKIKDYPTVIYTMAYQEGMIDALERALTFKGSGVYSDIVYLNGICDMYDNLLDKEIENKNFDNIPYVEGYTLGLLFLVIPKEDRPSPYPSLYFSYNKKKINTLEELVKILKKVSKNFPDEYKHALNLTKNMSENNTYHHPPYFL